MYLMIRVHACTFGLFLQTTNTMYFSRLEHVDEATLLLVNGFIRAIEKESEQDAVTPEVIITICLLYYYVKLINLSLPPKLKSRHGQPHYYAKKNCIILPTGSNESVQALQKYDVDKDEWEALSKYPESIKDSLSLTIMAVDDDKGLLYLFGGWHGIFAIYNLEDEFWRIIETFQGEMDGKALVLPNGELQSLYQRNMNHGHARWNEYKEKFESISTNSILHNCYLDGINFIYVPGKKWILQIGGYIGSEHGGNTDKIWYEEYKAGKKEYEWRTLPLRLTSKASARAVVVFDCVVIVFIVNGDEAGKVLILDLGVDDSEDYKWIESTLTKNEYPPRGCSMVLAKNGYLHFMNTWKDATSHFKIHLSALMPTKIYNKYRNN